jgi:hypothetical protein
MDRLVCPRSLVASRSVLSAPLAIPCYSFCFPHPRRRRRRCSSLRSKGNSGTPVGIRNAGSSAGIRDTKSTASGVNGPTVATAGAYSIDVEVGIENLSDSSEMLTCEVRGSTQVDPHPARSGVHTKLRTGSSRWQDIHPLRHTNPEPANVADIAVLRRERCDYRPKRPLVRDTRADGVISTACGQHVDR